MINIDRRRFIGVKSQNASSIINVLKKSPINNLK